jgi:hypothetical protein
MYQTSNKQVMFNLMFWNMFAILRLQLLAIITNWPYNLPNTKHL